jgi:hypothetical protein
MAPAEFAEWAIAARTQQPAHRHWQTTVRPAPTSLQLTLKRVWDEQRSPPCLSRSGKENKKEPLK